MHEKKQKLQEKAEREQEILRDSIYKHHFSVLQQQIEEKKRSKQIEDKEVLSEKELTEETYKPKPFKIKEMLDAQIEEKRRIREDLSQKEAAIDRLRLELARKSLENEMKNKSEGKQKLQNQLRDSWEKTQNTNKLQKAIDRLRRFGDNYIIDSEDELEDNNDNSMNEALLRYNKIIGKYSKNDEKRVETRESSLSKKVIIKQRSKSALSNTSKVSKDSQISAIAKLNKLKDEEDKIKQEKVELLKFLESRSHSKVSSRPVTVTSLFSKTADLNVLNSPTNNKNN